MDDFTKVAKLSHESFGLPVLVIVESQVLMRTLIVSTFKREFGGFEVIETATTNDLNRTLGRDVRLVVLGVGDKLVADSEVEYDLTLLAESFPQAAIALLSNRDDEETASEAMRWGVRGIFPTLDLPRDCYSRRASYPCRRYLSTIDDRHQTMRAATSRYNKSALGLSRDCRNPRQYPGRGERGAKGGNRSYTPRAKCCRGVEAWSSQ